MFIVTNDIYVAAVPRPEDRLGRFDGAEVLHIPTRLYCRVTSERSHSLNLQLVLAELHRMVCESAAAVVTEENHRVT